MPKRSAGILLYRRQPALEVLVVHPGGPFWARRDAGAWSIPKGGIDAGEEPVDAARRELGEELGAEVDLGPLLALGEIRQKAGKVVVAWAAEAAFDPSDLASNTFELEWPPRSGRVGTYPEVDRAVWAAPDAARRLLLAEQVALVDRLVALVEASRPR